MQLITTQQFRMAQELFKFLLHKRTPMIITIIKQLEFGKFAQYFLLIAQIANVFQH